MKFERFPRGCGSGHGGIMVSEAATRVHFVECAFNSLTCRAHHALFVD